MNELLNRVSDAISPTQVRDIAQATPMPASSHNALNPFPQFVPPPAYSEKINANDLDEALKECRHVMNKARLDALNAAGTLKEQKKAHWFIKRLVKTVNKTNIFRSDVMLKILAERGRKVYVQRERVVVELIKALSTFHDVFTGICPKTTITTLSDQIGATTYGQKLFFDVDEGVDPQLAKKKAIARTSRAVKDMMNWGLIEVANERDPVTGKYIGAVIRVTSRFYEVLSVPANDVDTARWDKIKHLQKTNRLPADIDMEENLEGYIQRKMNEVVEARRFYAKRKRQRRYLSTLNAVEMRERAARDVSARYGVESIKSMAQERFNSLLADRQRELYKLRSDPLRNDTYFDDIPFHINDIGDLLPYH